MHAICYMASACACGMPPRRDGSCARRVSIDTFLSKLAPQRCQRDTLTPAKANNCSACPLNRRPPPCPNAPKRASLERRRNCTKEPKQKSTVTTTQAKWHMPSRTFTTPSVRPPEPRHRVAKSRVLSPSRLSPKCKSPVLPGGLDEPEQP